MNFKVVLGFLSLFAVFLGVDHLLNQDHLAASTQTQASTESDEEKKKVILEMADFVQKNPKVLLGASQGPGQDTSVSAQQDTPRSVQTIAGIPLDEHTMATLQDPQGREQFKERISQNPMGAIAEVKQAFYSLDSRDIKSREVLLEITSNLIEVSNHQELKTMLLNEFERFHTQAGEGVHNPEYAGKALQHYFDSEKDQKKVIEAMEQRGIPYVDATAHESKENRAPASIESLEVSH